jgi:hypothetical protein
MPDLSRLSTMASWGFGAINSPLTSLVSIPSNSRASTTFLHIGESCQSDSSAHSCEMELYCYCALVFLFFRCFLVLLRMFYSFLLFFIRVLAPIKLCTVARDFDPWRSLQGDTIRKICCLKLIIRSLEKG